KNFHKLTMHAETNPAKMWCHEKWRYVITNFLRVRPQFVVLVVGLTSAAQHIPQISNRVIPCCGLPLNMSMCLVANSDLFVGVDSCMLHVADISRVPGVGLFGPTCSNEWGFRFSQHRHVTGEGTMEEICQDDVLAALLSLSSVMIA